jgi:uncharacterized membrane protein (DUF373 family)
MPSNVQPRDRLKLDPAGSAIIDPHAWNPPALRVATTALRLSERIIFGVVGLLLSAVALTLTFRSLQVVYSLVVSSGSMTIPLTANFLDLILLILMLAEIIYTVTLSLRGAVLSPQPFLIVGLIAVIRRILVITVQEVQTGHPSQTGWLAQNTLDLAVLTIVVMAFVFAICLLQRRQNAAAS